MSITAFGLAISIVQAMPVTIAAADAKGIRFIDDTYYVVNYLSVRIDYQDETRTQLNYEDRSLIEFDISGLSGTISNCTLDLSYGKFFDGVHHVPPSESIIDVFAYVGDGTVNASDFFAGGTSPFISFIGEVDYERGYTYTQIEVTSIIQAAVSAGEMYIGFRLSTQTDAVFSFGSMIAVPNPVLTVIPEPASVLLVAFGGLVVRKRFRGF
jgi:hypothetical protein